MAAGISIFGKITNLDLSSNNKNKPLVNNSPSLLKFSPAINYKNKNWPPTLAPFLNSEQLLDMLINKLKQKQPCSVVSVGATEAFVMAQYTLFSEDEIKSHPESIVANRGIQKGFEHRGIRLPNRKLRDEMIDAVKKADIVGYNTIVKPARNMAEEVFLLYDIKPQFIFEANIRRTIMFSQKKKFEEFLSGKKLLLIGSLADQARLALEQKYHDRLGFKIIGTIGISEYEEVPKVKEEISKYEFDLCLIAAGSNAVILSSYISNSLGKIAFDIGWGMQSLITGRIVTDEWLTSLIGIPNIMRM